MLSAARWHRRTSPPRGLTLVELLVVVAIVGMLVALVLPAVQSARESARRATCLNNLKQLALASQSHITALRHYPTGGWNSAATTIAMISPSGGADWRQPGGWAYTLLPHLDQQAIYDSGNIATDVPTFACASRRGSSIGAGGFVMTDYAGNRGSWASAPSPLAATDTSRDTEFGLPAATGRTIPAVYPVTEDEFVSLLASGTAAAALLNTAQPVLGSGISVPTGGVIFVGSALLPVRVRDGTASTYLFGEKYVPRADYATTSNVGYDHVAYAGDSPDTLRGGHRLPESDDTPWDDARQGAFGGPHPGAFNAAFCDGSVRSIDFLISAEIHFLLAAREDRQPVRPPD